jgi:phosphatidylethanolamine-binding protein (PEBP) family uncharacterized protein
MAAEGTPVFPKLTWTYVPDGTVSFVPILHDPDTVGLVGWHLLNISRR